MKIACELPAERDAPLSQWDCTEIARQLQDDGIVKQISRETVRRVLARHSLRPWRVQAWLSPKVPRDQQYRQQVADILALYTGPLAADERVLCVDEKTSLQPRPRTAPTHPAAPGRPVRMEHEYGRRGALNLFAAFDTRCGQVLARTASRKRASEFVGFLEYLDASLDPSLTIHLVLDNLRVHKGKLATAWFREHPRFVPHFPPVHCSWLNQVEQWFGILQRKLLARPNHPSAAALADTIEGFVERWNKAAHPFNWTSRSLCRVMAAPIPTPV